MAEQLSERRLSRANPDTCSLMPAVRKVPSFRTALSVEAGGEAEGLERGVMVAHVVDLEGGMGDVVLAG